MARTPRLALKGATAVLGFSLLGTPVAHAQSAPSVEQMIQKLKPASLKGPSMGVKPKNVAAAGAPAAQPVPVVQPVVASTTIAPPPQAPVDAPSLSLVVQFRTGSAELSPEAQQGLDHLGQALASADLSSFRFRIEGHTDTVGKPELNLSLSQRRAETVTKYLSGKYGIAPTRLVAAGLGSTQPAVPTADQVAESRNRRVQIVNLGA